MANGQCLHLLPAVEVAEEMALLDAEMLRRIKPDEIRDESWMDVNKKAELAPNVIAMVQAFNQLAHVVSTEVMQGETAHKRAKIVSTFIKIANKCYKLKNFNSVNAILAGLQCTPIYRLKKTWKEVSTKRKK